MSCWKGVGCSPIGGQETESGVGGECLRPWTSAFLPFGSIQAPSPQGGASHIQGRSFPLSCYPTRRSSLKTPSDCVSNLLGVSQSSQVDSSHQTLGVSGDKNRMCSLSLRLVTNHQYRLQGIPMAAGVIRGINIY